ncbi:hypothetical protein SKAU_G00226340, partial [Synaphobranchus kaupii]
HSVRTATVLGTLGGTTWPAPDILLPVCRLLPGPWREEPRHHPSSPADPRPLLRLLPRSRNIAASRPRPLPRRGSDRRPRPRPRRGSDRRPLPRPRGGGPPPPPPFLGAPGIPPPPAPPVIKLPYGLEPKKTYKPESVMKRINWSKIVPQEMAENCFWIKVKEERFETPDLLAQLSLNFSTKSKVKKDVDEVDNRKLNQFKKKAKE